jgi:hypothetical protein
MRMLMQVTMPHDPFNTYVKDGSAGQKIQKILAELKPEAAYFMEIDGLRSGVFIVNLPDASQIPAFAEPWFLTFHGDVRFRPVMTPEDLAKGGMEALGKKWA